jgi:hypothetical protein
MKKQADQQENLVEIQIDEPEDFLKIRETLERIGISNTKTKTLIQTCHILHKRGKYYVVHFKELLQLDGKEVNLTEEDIQRRDEIVKLLENWGLLHAVNKIKEYQEHTNLFVLPYKERFNGWKLQAKYQFGRVKEIRDTAKEKINTTVNETVETVSKKIFNKTEDKQ